MVKKHRILKFVKVLTKIIDVVKVKRMEWKLNFPLHPDTVSALSLIFSLLIFYNVILCLSIVLFFDLIGGAIARARNMASYRGQIVDWTTDRLSEFIIFGFLAINNSVMLVFPIINAMINMLVVEDFRVRGVPFYILPLRQILLGYLIFVSLPTPLSA